MSYVHPYSKRCDKGEVDLFTIPPTQQSLEKGRWIDYQPLSTVQNDDSAITFMISGTDEYLDLSKTILYVEGKIQNGDESDLSGGSQASIAPVNNFLHSLFKQVDVYFNGKQVTPAMGTYAYRSYIETLLNYDVTAKQSQFSSALYYKDTAGHFEESGSLPAEKTIAFVKSTYGGGQAPTNAQKETVKITVPGTGNQGFAKRHEFIKSSREFVLTGPFFSDVFMSDRLLLNMMELKVVLNRSPNTFCLLDKNTTLKNPRVKLTNVVLKVRKVKVDPSIAQANEIVLKKSPAFYPIRRVECKVLSIPGGLSTVRKDNIFSGLVPNTFVFGLVDLDAFNGQYKSNPYNFQHFGVKNISLTANGEEIPFKQLTLTYPNKDGTNSLNVDYIQAYNTLFSGTGKMYANTGLDISRDEYAHGNTLYAFDLTPDMCHSTEYFNVVQRGSLSVALTFDNSENPNVAMVCYGDFENVIRIDGDRNVIYDIS